VHTNEFMPLAWAETGRAGGNNLLVQSTTDYLKQTYYYRYVREREEWSASIAEQAHRKTHSHGWAHLLLGYPSSPHLWRPPLYARCGTKCGSVRTAQR
jgi:hypothetical protein